MTPARSLRCVLLSIFRLQVRKLAPKGCVSSQTQLRWVVTSHLTSQSSCGGKICFCGSCMRWCLMLKYSFMAVTALTAPINEGCMFTVKSCSSLFALPDCCQARNCATSKAVVTAAAVQICLLRVKVGCCNYIHVGTCQLESWPVLGNEIQSSVISSSHGTFLAWKTAWLGYARHACLCLCWEVIRLSILHLQLCIVSSGV